jgi:hypothetical protein
MLPDAVWEMNDVQADDGKANWGPPAFFESQIRTMSGAAAISTQFELSPL